MFERDVLRVGLDVGRSPHPELAAKGVPFALDLVDGAEQRDMMRFAFSYLVYIRPFVTPPNLPADRLKILQSSFAATFADKAFLAEAEKSDLEIRYVPPDRVMEALDAAFEAPEQVKRNAVAKLKEAGFDGL
jgi:hypothetical protein